MKRTLSAIMAVIVILTTFFSVGTVVTSAATLKTPYISQTESVSNGVKITWTKVSGAAKYRVFVKSGNHWKTLGNTTSTSWIDKTAKTGKSYTYTVRCISSNGKNYTSNYNHTGFSTKHLSTPSGIKVQSVSNGHRISWTKVANADKYRIFIRKNNRWSTVATTAQTTYTINRTHGIATYTVRCLSKDNKRYTSYYNTKGATLYEANMPYFNQAAYFDVPFGKVLGATIGSHGSGLVAFSMVLSSLKPQTITPRELIKWNQTSYYCTDAGLKWSYFKNAAAHYGISCESNASFDQAIQALKKGKVVINVQRPGYFTNAGHYIVLRGITSDGKILVSDPNGYNANKWGLSTQQYLYKEWTLDQIKASSVNSWIFSK